MALGASDTTEFDKMMGALGMLSGSKAGAQKAFDAASAMYAPVEEANPWEASLRFFLEMGKQASQPGATVLGSAVGSGLVPLDYLTAKKKEKRDRDQKVASTAFSLAPSLKPKAGKVTYRPATAEELKQYGKTSGQMGSDGKFYDLSKTTGTGSTTKPFDVQITESGKNAFALAFPNAALPADGIIALRSDQLSTLPVGGYEIVQDKNQSQSRLSDYTFNSPEAVAAFKVEYPEVILSAGQVAGTEPISLNNAQVANPALLNAFNVFNKKGAGSQFERITSRVNDIGTRMAAHLLDPDNVESPSQSELNQYSIEYQKLITGGEYTETVDGQEVTRYRPGIDLSETTNLPIPEGLDLEKIIEQRAVKFDQDQKLSATYGSRMLYNEGIIRNVTASGYEVSLADIAQIRAQQILGLGSIGVSDQAQQFHIAAQNWAAANLRRESGAAIGPQEYADALEQYFPKVGDTAQTRDNKRALREAVTGGMIEGSTGAFEVMYPDGEQFLSYTDTTTLGPDGRPLNKRYEILNPQGYANLLLKNSQLGKSLFFQQTLDSMTLPILRSMFRHPNAENLYTSEMLDMIDAEINSR